MAKRKRPATKAATAPGPRQQRKQWTEEELQEALQFMQSTGCSVRDAAAHTGVPKSTLYRYSSGKQKIGARSGPPTALSSASEQVNIRNTHPSVRPTSTLTLTSLLTAGATAPSAEGTWRPTLTKAAKGARQSRRQDTRPQGGAVVGAEVAGAGAGAGGAQEEEARLALSPPASLARDVPSATAESQHALRGATRTRRCPRLAALARATTPSEAPEVTDMA
jgi:transposase-like protein